MPAARPLLRVIRFLKMWMADGIQNTRWRTELLDPLPFMSGFSAVVPGALGKQAMDRSSDCRKR